MNFQEMAQELKIKNGDFVSVAKWINSNDGSYVGALLQVTAISSQFIRVLHMDGILKGVKTTLSLDKVEITPLDDDFIADILADEENKEAAK